MTCSKLFLLLNSLEINYPVSTWTINSLQIWPLVRFELGRQACNSSNFSGREVLPSQLGSQTIRPSIFNKISLGTKMVVSLIQAIRNSILDNGFLKTKNITTGDILFFDFDTNMVRINNKFFSRTCDPFITYFKNQGLTCITFSTGYRYPAPRHTKSFYIQPQLLGNRLAAKFGRNTQKIHLRRFKNAIEIVKKELIINNEKCFYKNILYKVQSIQKLEMFFCKKLCAIKPKLVFLSSYYCTEPLALILACKKLKIPVVDIQHGVAGDAHFAYGKWKKIPKKGYSLLPDFFWCWSKTESSSIKKWSRNACLPKTLQGGNLFLKRWAGTSDKNNIFYDKQIKNKTAANRKKTQILFTCYPELKTELIKLLYLLKKANKDKLSYFFWIRLHPTVLNKKRFVQSQINQHNLKNWDINDATNYPLYALLRHMDLHITTNSSVVIEAEAFGVPSICLDVNCNTMFSDQIKRGVAIVASRKSSIIAAIKTQLKIKQKLQKNINLAQQEKEILNKLVYKIKKMSKKQYLKRRS